MTELILLVVSFCGEFGDRFEQCNDYMFKCHKQYENLPLEQASEICEETLPYDIWRGY